MDNYQPPNWRKAYIEFRRTRQHSLQKMFPFLYRGFNPNWIEINHFNLSLPNLPTSFDRYRIVQIGDIHMGTWMTRQRLEGVVALVNQQKPDLILNTGDYFSYDHAPYEQDLIEGLKNLQARDGCLSTLGNHDYWVDHQAVTEVLLKAGTQPITNQVHCIEKDGQSLFIAGGASAYDGYFTLKPLTTKIPPNSCAIMLTHEPDVADEVAETGLFSLQLSGHSHGGQMILPVYGPAVKVRKAEKYPLGMYKIHDMWLYTNRGLGTNSIPLRINCPPEITVFELNAQP